MGKHGKKLSCERCAQSRPGPRLHARTRRSSWSRSSAYAKFDETVEVHMRLNVDPRQADQQVRSMVSLPAGTGKSVRILVFAEGEAARLAQEAGADYVGTDEYVQRIQEGWTRFRRGRGHPQVMGKIGRLGRVLGPRGLMPNPKAGTVVQPDDIADTIRAVAPGACRVPRGPHVQPAHPHRQGELYAEQLMANLAAVMDAVMRARPATVKGAYIRRIALTSTMGPGLQLDINAAQNRALRHRPAIVSRSQSAILGSIWTAVRALVQYIALP